MVLVLTVPRVLKVLVLTVLVLRVLVLRVLVLRVLVLKGHSRDDPLDGAGALLRGGRLSHRSLATCRPRGDHARAQRPRESRIDQLPVRRARGTRAAAPPAGRGDRDAA